MAFESDPEDPEPDPDDLPLHPTIVRWLAAYARAADNERDAVVARMLGELNALLQRSAAPERLERGPAPPA